MFTLSAQELKQGGISAIKRQLKHSKEILVKDRGKDACVVIDLDYYNQLHLCELEVAYLKAKTDIANGKFEIISNVEKHVKHVMQEIEQEELLKD